MNNSPGKEDALSFQDQEKSKSLELQYVAALSPEEIRRMFHELRSHQIELSMQNEELRRTQAELEESLARYSDLYDLAPVAYCTISEQGLILEANLTIAALLGVTRSMLATKPLSRYIFADDQDNYYLHRKKFLETGEHQAYELRMVKNDGKIFWVHLTGVAAMDADNARLCRVVISDISDRKRTEEKFKGQLEELQRWQDIMLDREDRVQELKREVNELCRRIGESARYASQKVGPEDSETVGV